MEKTLAGLRGRRSNRFVIYAWGGVADGSEVSPTALPVCTPESTS
jgi:hypothetical protein